MAKALRLSGMRFTSNKSLAPLSHAMVLLSKSTPLLFNDVRHKSFLRHHQQMRQMLTGYTHILDFPKTLDALPSYQYST